MLANKWNPTNTLVFGLLVILVGPNKSRKTAKKQTKNLECSIGVFTSTALRTHSDVFIYVALIRPHLEYAVPVWDPHLVKHSDLLEKVQKFALKVCTKSWNSTYNSQLAQTCLYIPRLDQRCVQLKLSYLYQIVNNLSFCPNTPATFRNMSVNVRSNNPFLLNRPVCRTNSHYFSFYPHSISLWNDLPPSITSATTLSSFKRRLNTHLSS